jgi:gamma-glutamyltranspeptidase/glutathione hydrolase
MIATPHDLATAAGADVLRRGGNAVDAAIAANGVLSVVFPASCGLGGDAFWIVHDPKRGGQFSYNASGRTPHAAALDGLPGGVLPQRGALAVTVPGAVRSWEDVGRAHGTRGLDDLLAPAESYARDGFAASNVVADYFALNAPVLRDDPETSRIFLSRGIPRAGDRLVNRNLADTIGRIRREGADAFYTGKTAAAIVKTLRAGGSRMTLDDLASHATQPTTPVRMAWNGGELLAHPPNSQGACLLMGCGMLAGDRGADESLWHHLGIEAMKRTLEIRDASFCDPAFGDAHLDAVLRPEHLAALRAEIDPDRARSAEFVPLRGGTIFLGVVDENGMAVSLIESLYMNFGSGLIAEGTGIFLQNRGACFSTTPGNVNVYAGGKRPMHTLSPPMFLRDGAPELVFGNMGGDGQPQIQLQVLHHYYDRGFDVQAAVDQPRWIYGRHTLTERPDIDPREAVLVESRFDPAVLASLERKGHTVVPLGPYENAMGHAHAIAIDRERGTLAGGADPRADSLALGL